MKTMQLPILSLMTMAALLGACGQSASEKIQAATNDIVKTPPPTLLTRLEMDSGRTIEFLENEPGDVFIVENGNQDRHRPKLTAQFVNGKSLPEIYQALSGANITPRVLEEAQARRLSTPDDSLEGAAQSPADPNPEFGQTPITANQAARATPQAVNWDWVGDANWFNANFCKTQYDHFCATNAGSAWSWKQKDLNYTYFEVTGMNASFEGGAYLYSDYYKCKLFSCSWRRSWDGHIAPRWYQTLIYTKKRPRYARIDGNGLNYRVHFAAMRVVEGKPTPPSLSVSAQGGQKFRVTGSGYKSNAAVYVHIGYGNFTGEAMHTIISNSSGGIDATLNQTCNNGWQMAFAANDGRLNPDTGGDLFSNTAYATCQ